MIIYCLTNTTNGKRYVGQTCDAVEARWKAHISSARRNEGCRVLGAAIRKYGAEAFTRDVLEVVATQKEADIAETKWIAEKQSRVPGGYNLTAGGGSNGRHHEDSKQLIGEASRDRLHRMSPEERAAYLRKNIHRWTPQRRDEARARARSKIMREKVAAGQKDFWSKFTPEEKSKRVRHQLASMTAAQKSERVRKAWANMSPEARAERLRKTKVALIAAGPKRSKKMSAWQTAQAKLRTPEQRRAMVLKAWVTRRAKYGQQGHREVQTA